MTRLHVQGAAGACEVAVCGIFRRADDLKATAAPSVRNDALAVLRETQAETVLLCNYGMTPLFLVRLADGAWTDARGNRLRVTRAQTEGER